MADSQGMPVDSIISETSIVCDVTRKPPIRYTMLFMYSTDASARVFYCSWTNVIHRCVGIIQALNLSLEQCVGYEGAEYAKPTWHMFFLHFPRFIVI